MSREPARNAAPVDRRDRHEQDPTARDPASGSPNALGRYIRTQRELAELSLRKLAGIAGVSNPYLSQIERGLRKPSADILQAIARALHVSRESLYVKAGLLEDRELRVDVIGAIATDPALTQEQRQTLIEMYRSLRTLSELQRKEGGSDAPGYPSDRSDAASDRPDAAPDR